MNKKRLYILPSLFTLANMAFGFYGIIAAINQKWIVTGIALTMAVIMDGFDGRIARLTKTTSDFGLNFDSIVDVISFGVAPAIIVYLKWIQPNVNYNQFGWLLCFLYLAAGATRLARFNVLSISAEKSNKFFKGLPIPAAAGIISTVLWVSEKRHIGLTVISKAMPFVIIFLAYLMISNIPYNSLKSKNKNKKNKLLFLIFVILALILLVTVPDIFWFLFAFLYVLSGLLKYLFKTFKHENEESKDE